MVTTPPTVGYVSVYDYLTDGDMDIQEESGKTIGTDFFRGPPINYRTVGKLDMEKELYYGGKGYAFRYDSIDRVVSAVLKCDETELKNIYNYYYLHKDNEGAKEYLCWRKGSGDFYDGFFDENGSSREYCEGVLGFVSDSWASNVSNLYEVMIVFHEVL